MLGNKYNLLDVTRDWSDSIDTQEVCVGQTIL